MGEKRGRWIEYGIHKADSKVVYGFNRESRRDGWNLYRNERRIVGDTKRG